MQVDVGFLAKLMGAIGAFAATFALLFRPLLARFNSVESRVNALEHSAEKAKGADDGFRRDVGKLEEKLDNMARDMSKLTTSVVRTHTLLLAKLGIPIPFVDKDHDE